MKKINKSEYFTMVGIVLIGSSLLLMPVKVVPVSLYVVGVVSLIIGYRLITKQD